MNRVLFVVAAAIVTVALAALFSAAMLVVFLVAAGEGDGPLPFAPSDKFEPPVAASLRADAEQVRDAMRGHSRAADLAHVYRRLSETFATEQVVTTEQVRLIHEYVGDELRKDDASMVVPGELQQVEALVARHTGLGSEQIPNRKLTDELRAKVVEAFAAIAWACHDAGAGVFRDPPDPQPQGLKMEPAEEAVERLEEGEPIFRGPEIGGSGGIRGPPNYGLVPPSAEEKAALAKEIPAFGSFRFPSAEGKTRLLYRAALAFDPGAYSEKQTAGDCVSHAARNAVDAHRAFAIIVEGQPYQWRARGATEPIYAARGSSRDRGMTIYRAAKAINEDGYALRQVYGSVDLSQYDGSRGVAWGGSGVPSVVREGMRPHTVGRVASVQSVEEARDAIGNGYPLFVGSDYGFSSKRDRNGFSERRGTWYHAMAWLAVAPESDLVPGSSSPSPCFLIQNSWGEWNGGPKGKYDIPTGSFWVDAGLARGMISQGQAVAVGDFLGFEPEPLADWGFRLFTRKPKSIFSVPARDLNFSLAP